MPSSAKPPVRRYDYWRHLYYRTAKRRWQESVANPVNPYTEGIGRKTGGDKIVLSSL